MVSAPAVVDAGTGPGRHCVAMPLHEYRRKRDFAKTPEPPGEPAAATTTTTAAARDASSVPGGRFVVQRHRATRLHYDFRLEIDGVLVSWAVPKGPTLDPAVRRMAVHVEDHPLEYFDFEGVIPKGEYGGGDVIVWDWGTWTPDPETPDGARAVADGELKFSLRGEKLRGRFTLVRTSGRGSSRSSWVDEGGDEQWLLIHKRDADAVAGWDPEAFPQSVKTGRTNDEVRAARDAIWISHAPASTAQIDLSSARREPMPSFIEPMAATLADRAFDDADWLFEVKWDGYRVEAVVHDGAVRIFTRNGHDAEAYFPKLLTPATWINAAEAIVDGEVVAMDDHGRPDFSLLQELSGKPSSRFVYQAFDLLYLDGRSLLGVPLEDRKALLRAVLRTGDRRVRYADHVVGEGRAFLDAAAAQGLEGVIAKHRRSAYEPGVRARSWLKIKHRPEQELVVGGFTPGEGAAKDLGALVVGYYDGEDDRRGAEGASGRRSGPRLHFAGKVGSGFSAATRRLLRRRLEALAIDEPPFDPAPPRDYKGRWGGDLERVIWVRPEIVIRARLGGWTRDGLVRQAAFRGLDEGGKPPIEVVREKPVATGPTVEAVEEALPSETPPAKTKTSRGPGAAARSDVAPAFAGATDKELDALATMKPEGLWSVGGHELKLTNLDKVLFPPRKGEPEADGSKPKKGAVPAPITKRELVRYFARIAPAMLPHLAGRPLNLHRYPNGPAAPGFWQKDIPETAPSWLRRWREVGVEAREANEHLVAEDAATLAWLGNQAAFEVHAWTSRIEDPMTPTFALIDIDPGEETTWDETVTLAKLFRTALQHLSVRGYPKTTGKRGIQVWIPIEPKYSFHETSDWVEQLSRAVGQTVPDLVSWEWSKSRRGGRARLDYTQNTYIKTLVAPYAVRPADGAPVSTPIAWDELDDAELRSDRWTIRTVVERVAEKGDLFAGAQADLQELPSL
jgi:bifunctional non-homologous end joining protein LigD